MPLGLLNNYSLINWKHPLMRGLVSRWKVMPNRIGGSRFVDLCGRNHGTLTNGAAWTSNYVYLDGTDDRIDIPSSPLIENTVAHTFRVVLAVRTVGSVCTLASKEAASASGYGFYITAAVLHPYIRIGAAWSDMVGPTLVAGTIYDIVQTYDGATHICYVNGRNVVQASIAGAITQNTNSLRIGDKYDNTTRTPGNYYEVGYWGGRALSSSEVFSLYQATRQKYDPTLNYQNNLQFRPILYSNFLVQYNNLPAYLGLNVLNGL